MNIDEDIVIKADKLDEYIDETEPNEKELEKTVDYSELLEKIRNKND